MHRKFMLIIIMLLTGTLAACAAGPTEPTATPTEAPEATATTFDYGEEGTLPAEANDLIESARADLAARLEIDRDSIEVAHVEVMNWPDASLGCPQFGVDYATVVTPGYQIELRAEGDIYQYHTDEDSQLILCRDGEPRLPVVPMEAEGTPES